MYPSEENPFSIYECDQCSAALSPGVMACPACGAAFDEPVPVDAGLPEPGLMAHDPVPNLESDRGPAETAEFLAVKAVAADAHPRTGTSNTDTLPVESIQSLWEESFASPRARWNRNVVTGGLLAIFLLAGLIFYGFHSVLGINGHASSPSVTSPVLSSAKTMHTVTYKVFGSAHHASITYQNAANGSDQFTRLPLPWSIQFQAPDGAFLYLLAQNQASDGELTIEIDVDGLQRKQKSASGAYAIADAYDTL